MLTVCDARKVSFLIKGVFPTCTKTYICHILLKLVPLLYNMNLMSDDPVSAIQSLFRNKSTLHAHLNPLFGFHVIYLFMFLNIYQTEMRLNVLPWIFPLFCDCLNFTLSSPHSCCTVICCNLNTQIHKLTATTV